MKTYSNYVVIIPLVGSKFIIQKQYKPGAQKICMGFPAGFVEKGENTLSAAKRELFEESGYESKNWKRLGSFYDNTSVSKAMFTIFLAKNSQKTSQHNNPDSLETEIQHSLCNLKDLEKIKMEGACMALAKLMAIHSL